MMRLSNLHGKYGWVQRSQEVLSARKGKCVRGDSSWQARHEYLTNGSPTCEPEESRPVHVAWGLLNALIL